MNTRVLVTAWGWHSHLRPMLPLSTALAAAGHDVILAVPPSLLPSARASGLPAVPVGRDIDALPAFRALVLPTPPTAGPPRALAVFCAAAEAMVADLVSVGRTRGADLVVFEPTALAGPLAASAIGVPAVRHLYGPDLMLPARRWLAELLEPAAGRLGMDAVPDPLGQVTVDPWPDALGEPVDHPRLRIRQVAAVAPVVRRARPRVVVTWGDTMALLDERLMLAGRFARILAGARLDVTVVIGAGQRRLLGVVPDGVRVAERAQLPALLASADVVLSQGGAGTVLAGLVHGVPQVVVGQLPDHLAIGRRVAGGGAGAVLAPAEATDDALHAAVEAVATEPGYRAAARAIARENAACPAPASLVAPVSSLTLETVHSGVLR